MLISLVVWKLRRSHDICVSLQNTLVKYVRPDVGTGFSCPD